MLVALEGESSTTSSATLAPRLGKAGDRAAKQELEDIFGGTREGPMQPAESRTGSIYDLATATRRRPPGRATRLSRCTSIAAGRVRWAGQGFEDQTVFITIIASSGGGAAGDSGCWGDETRSSAAVTSRSGGADRAIPCCGAPEITAATCASGRFASSRGPVSAGLRVSEACGLRDGLTLLPCCAGRLVIGKGLARGLRRNTSATPGDLTSTIVAGCHCGRHARVSLAIAAQTRGG